MNKSKDLCFRGMCDLDLLENGNSQIYSKLTR